MIAISFLLVSAIAQCSSDPQLDRYRKDVQPIHICGRQECPEKWRSKGEGSGWHGGTYYRGLVCTPTIDSYFRGWGYPWQIGDTAFDTSGAVARCDKEHSFWGCESWGLMAYPRCVWGFTNDLCCYCKASCPGVKMKPDEYSGTECLLPCKEED